MNYKRIHDYIITRAKNSAREKLPKKSINYIYYENHHIIPKCFGGTNEKDNMVLLTSKEHYLVHKCLYKLTSKNTPENYIMLCVMKRFFGFTKEKSGSEYERIKLEHAAILSKNMKNKIFSEETKKKISDSLKGNKNFYGKKHTEETKKKMCLSQAGEKNGFFGKSHTDTTKKQISEKMKGVKKSPETIEKFKLRKDSEETKRKKSESIKEWHRQRKLKNDEMA